MTTPSRPRNDLFLKGLKTTNNKRDVLAADVTRLTDEEAEGSAKTATFAWIETASERELNGWLTLSDRAFIDAVKAKGHVQPPNQGAHRAECRGYHYGEQEEAPVDVLRISSPTHSTGLFYGGRTLLQVWRLYRFKTYNGNRDPLFNIQVEDPLYATRRAAAGLQPPITPENLIVHYVLGAPAFLWRFAIGFTYIKTSISARRQAMTRKTTPDTTPSPKNGPQDSVPQ
ncbi:hypothetical protein PROFUN_14383 [Planoprotostelium fungivorum]|uniref:Uncharacterized protein n=1 Tax=Planoprotostelium fungivorum TaxID=1890364 RepID=A0A2P6MVW7_9EUKA|nr:hypothetical protein PROFUN_14383 [Planoprotostelium fungivorum]